MMKLIKTAGLALLSSCLIALPVVGCSQSQVDQVLQKIQANIPVAEGLATSVAPIIELLDPASAALVQPGLLLVNTGLTELGVLITQYEANPDATVLGKIQNLVNSIVSGGSTALLAAAHITDTAVQQKIIAVFSALQASLVIIDGLIQNIEPVSVVKANAATRTVKLSQIDQYLDHKTLDQYASANGTTYAAFYAQEVQSGY